MPFTLSHAAAVLPAVRADGTGRARLVPAVLVAGSFSPDMTYFAASVVPGAMEFGNVTHSLAGAFTVDVAVAWALVGLWLLVREPVLALLPRAWRRRPAALLGCGVPRARVRPSVAARWYVSGALGALSHVVWDAFTHHDRWGVRALPVLEHTVAGSPLYLYLQYGSSVAGAAVIAVWGAWVLRRAAAPAMPERSSASAVPALSARDRWLGALLIGGCAAVGAVERAAQWWSVWGATAKPWELIPSVCFGTGAGLVPGLVLYVIGVRVRRPAGERDATAGGEGAGSGGGGSDGADATRGASGPGAVRGGDAVRGGASVGAAGDGGAVSTVGEGAGASVSGAGAGDRRISRWEGDRPQAR